MSVKESSEGGEVRLTCFEVVPSPHGDLTAIELALIFQACLLRLLARRLARVAPAKVIELPECVCWKYEIPNG